MIMTAIKYILILLGFTLSAYSIVGSIQIQFTPMYVAVQPPNECSSGSHFVYAGPESNWNVSVEVADE